MNNLLTLRMSGMMGNANVNSSGNGESVPSHILSEKNCSFPVHSVKAELLRFAAVLHEDTGRYPRWHCSAWSVLDTQGCE